MDITTRDVVSVLGLFFMGAGVYVAIVQRVTRMEAMGQRMDRVERKVEDLEELGSTAGASLAGILATLLAYEKRIEALEDTVQSGIAEVLDAIRAKPGDRRGTGVQ
jgi:hypothetical protein